MTPQEQAEQLTTEWLEGIGDFDSTGKVDLYESDLMDLDKRIAGILEVNRRNVLEEAAKVADNVFPDAMYHVPKKHLAMSIARKIRALPGTIKYREFERVKVYKESDHMLILGVICSKCGHEERVQNVSVRPTSPGGSKGDGENVGS